MRTKHGHRNMLRGVPFPLNDSLLNDMPIFNSTSIEFSLTCFPTMVVVAKAKEYYFGELEKSFVIPKNTYEKQRDMHL